MSNNTFKRGQVEWALWRSFRPVGSRDSGPTTVFRTRIKRLLELDRDFPKKRPVDLPCAFTASFEGGSGVEAAYTEQDAFALALALDLLNAGFKQGEIVLVMRHLREILDDWHADLIARPNLNDRQRVRPDDYPELPAYQETGKKTEFVDARVFLLLNRIEITEVLSIAPAPGKTGDAVFSEPEVCEGLTKLQERLHRLMPLARRMVIVLEMTAIAQSVSRWLQDAPLVPRGRPRQQA